MAPATVVFLYASLDVSPAELISSHQPVHSIRHNESNGACKNARAGQKGWLNENGLASSEKGGEFRNKKEVEVGCG